MADFKKIALASAGVAAISYGLGWIYKFFPEGLVNLSFSAVEVPVREQIKSGFDTTIAGKLLSYLGGSIPQGGVIAALIMLYVAAFVVVWLGSFISERINFGKTETVKFAVGMTLAAVILGIVVGTMSPTIGALGTMLAMLIYFGIVALVYVAARNIEGLKDFFPVVP